MLIVLTTVADNESAEALARGIVEAKLAACVQVLPRMTSVYFWEGKVQSEGEHLLLIKTLEENYADLETFILAEHSYDVPEVVAIRTDHVSEGYRGWLESYLR